MGYWLRGYEGERNNCFSKISKISFSKVDQKDIEITNPFLPPKHYKYGGPVSVKRRLQTGGKTKTGGKMQTADCRPGVKCRLSANWKKKKKKRHEDQVRVKWRLGFVCVPVIFFPKFSNSHQNAFPSLSQTLHYQTRVLELPILFPQGPERIVILCILPLLTFSAILNCVYAIRSGTDQLSISFILFFHRQILRITFKAPRVLVALKGVCNCSEHKASKNTAAQQQSKLNM